MRKLFALIISLSVGIVIGSFLGKRFIPDELANDLRQGFDETMDEARRASLARRQELEDEMVRRLES